MSKPPTPPGIPTDPNLFKVLTEIDMIAHMAKNEFERLLPEGVTQAQFGVLNRLTRLDARETITELSAAFQVTQPTMTSTLKRLLAKDYVSLKVDQTDRRVKRVVITKGGRALRDKVISDMTPYIMEQNQAIGELDFGTLLSDLAKIRTQFEERLPK